MLTEQTNPFFIITRRFVILNTVAALYGCANPRPPAQGPDLDQTLPIDETYIATNVIFIQAAHTSIRLYHVGSVLDPQPSAGFGPSQLQCSITKPAKPVENAETGVQLFRVKVGWLRLGGASYMNKSATLNRYVKLAANSINYIGDITVDAGINSISVRINVAQPSLVKIAEKYKSTSARYPVVQRILV